MALEVKLEEAYYNQGFFNVPVANNRGVEEKLN